MAESSSSNFSSSSSTPTIFNTPQSDFLLQLGQYAQSLAQASKQWADQAYANSSAVTNDNINGYRNINAQALQMANNDTQRYQQLFQPEENQLLLDANTYASPDRMKAEMGAAASGQQQAGDQALQNARQKLQSFGIDPSSGRYADLEQSERVKTAAAAAGAAQQARLATEGTGRALRSEAIQVGERYPGQIINSLNTGAQALTGAENAALGNENAGANAMRVPQGYVQAGMGVKLPLMGNNSQSQGSGSGSSNSPDPSRGGGGGGGGNNGGSGNAGSGDFMNPSNYDSMSGGPGQVWAPQGGSGAGQGSGFDWNSINTDPTLQSASSFGDTMTNPGVDTSYSGNGWIDSAGAGGFGAGTGDYSTPTNSWGSDYSTPTSVDWGSTPSYGEQGGLGDYSSSTNDYTGAYASGGAIPAGPTTGGGVSPAMSPSGGQQTDDVNAHLNAGEFVLPRDIVAWKGQEFFQKLIADARAKMGGAPAHGKPAAPRPGPANFRSQAIPT